MASNPFKKLNAKILLFGEHLINIGSPALSIPYEKFNGQLELTNSEESRLNSFLDFLRQHRFDFLDEKKLLLREKLQFNSNIPEGYGCGSSGAIVAACYDFYKSDESLDPTVLRDRFAKMESYYHGKSSGTDPLISYFNLPIKFNDDQKIQLLPNLQTSLENYSLILVDSGQPREGKKYINWFMDKAKEKNFKSVITDQLLPATQSCISAFLDSTEEDFKSSFATISSIQAEHMSMMIPDNVKNLWVEGTRSNNLYLKICGAGGGGFFIGLLRKNTELDELNRFKTYSLT